MHAEGAELRPRVARIAAGSGVVALALLLASPTARPDPASTASSAPALAAASPSTASLGVSLAAVEFGPRTQLWLAGPSGADPSSAPRPAELDRVHAYAGPRVGRISSAAVTEPSTLALLGLFAGLAAHRRAGRRDAR
jgi:hypothetical protein